MKELIGYCNKVLKLNIDYPKNDNELFKLYNFLKGILDYKLHKMLKEIELPIPNSLSEQVFSLQDKDKVIILPNNTSNEEIDKLMILGYTILFDTGEYLSTPRSVE